MRWGAEQCASLPRAERSQAPEEVILLAKRSVITVVIKSPSANVTTWLVEAISHYLIEQDAIAGCGPEAEVVSITGVTEEE